MTHKKTKQSTGSWKGNRDEHQKADKTRAATERRHGKSDWTPRGKNTKKS